VNPSDRRSDPSVPRHVALVMDGNGRWARKRYMPRVYGHKQGVDALVRVVNTFADRGVDYLTVFAFSSENWKRPSDEVSGLMSLVLVAVSKYLAKLAGDGVRIRIVGDRAKVSNKLRDAWQYAESSTAHNARINLSVCFNYGGRWDVVQACRRAMLDGVAPEAARRGGAVALHGAELRARPRPVHPHRRRDAHQQLHAVAVGVLGVLLHRAACGPISARPTSTPALRAYAAARPSLRRHPERRPGAAARLNGASMLGQRVITAIVLLALLVPALFASQPWPFHLLTLLLIAAAGWEWGR
jgi:hypothetical protein